MHDRQNAKCARCRRKKTSPHREQVQCKANRERKECTYMCVSVRARKSEIAELATGCLGCVLLHQLVSVQRAHVCAMCKSWSLCCSVQTLVRVRLKSWTSVWCSAHRACTKAQKQQSSGQRQRIRAAGASPRCMNPNPRHSQCAVRMSMSHFPSLCIFPANTIFVYFPQT